MTEQKALHKEPIATQTHTHWTLEIYRDPKSRYLEFKFVILDGMPDAKRYAGFAIELYEHRDRKDGQTVRSIAQTKLTMAHEDRFILTVDQQPSWLAAQSNLQFGVWPIDQDGQAIDRTTTTSEEDVILRHCS